MANSMSTSRPTPYKENIKTGKTKAGIPITEDNPQLFKARASRLTDLFPNELVIQQKTVSIIRNAPFISAIETIPIRDIGRVVYVDSIIFGGIEILGKNTAHDLKIKGLNKAAARTAEDIIEKLLLEAQNPVDMPDWIQHEKQKEIIREVLSDSDPTNDWQAFRKK